MKNKINTYFLFILIMVLSVSWRPTGDKVEWVDVNKDSMSTSLEATNNHLLHLQSYAVDIVEASYSDYTTNASHERSVGYLKKMRDNYHSYILGVHTIQDKDCRVAVDSAKKMILVADPTDYFNKVFTASDFSILLKVCTKVKKATSGRQTFYRLEFDSKAPLSAYEYTVKDSLPERVVLYYNKVIKGNNEQIASKPRMEITFNNWHTGISSIRDGYSIEKYLYKKDNMYVLKAPYSSRYKLADDRVLTKFAKK